MKNLIITILFILGLMYRAQAQSPYIPPYTSIYHPANTDYVYRLAISLHKDPSCITQYEFDKQYSTFPIILGSVFTPTTYYIYNDDNSPYGVWIYNQYYEHTNLSQLIQIIQQVK